MVKNKSKDRQNGGTSTKISAIHDLKLWIKPQICKILGNYQGQVQKLKVILKTFHQKLVGTGTPTFFITSSAPRFRDPEQAGPQRPRKPQGRRFSFLAIFNLQCVPFHPVVVVALGYDFLFKFLLAHCEETNFKPTCIIVHSTVITIMRLFLFDLPSTSIQCQTIIIIFHITQWVNDIKQGFLNLSFTGRFLLEKLFWFDRRVSSSFNCDRKSLNIVSTIVAGTGTTRIGGTSAPLIVLFRIKGSESSLYDQRLEKFKSELTCLHIFQKKQTKKAQFLP